MTTEITYDTKFRFSGRGMGSNWLPCFICGHQPKEKCQADQAFFVDPKEIHVSTLINPETNKPIVLHPLMQWFHDRDILCVNLDYRASEPNRVQIKLGACGEHEPNLELLGYLSAYDDNRICQRTLDKVIPKRKRP